MHSPGVRVIRADPEHVAEVHALSKGSTNTIFAENKPNSPHLPKLISRRWRLRRRNTEALLQYTGKVARTTAMPEQQALLLARICPTAVDPALFFALPVVCVSFPSYSIDLMPEDGSSTHLSILNTSSTCILLDTLHPPISSFVSRA